ncbi:histidine phosphatase family protein [Baekduia soli]|uniref:Histidine phosphatase family protein n=1 Tax=Baekduia soli TaxID=496014 RepID=A0A5B8U3M6_9ACTN|nr:histidine phosphatase family protein [Baekduia soli]QEC47654.1 histidine phosphatase family protein [Baekduia soli]
MHELWLIRHAETPWSLAGRHTGRSDIPLTDAGREHARGLRDRLGGRAFAAVLVSPLVRARETAQLAGLDAGALVRDDLMEWDYGDYEGRTTAEIRAERPDWLLWRDGVPGGESAADVGARADRVIAEALGIDGDVALVAHGHVLRVLAARWTEQDPAFGGRLALRTAGVGRCGFERETRVLTGWNV